jgi:hypothetical protein
MQLILSLAFRTGFVMSMYSLLRSKPTAPTEEEIEEALAGNLWWASISSQRHCCMNAVTSTSRV